jgi:hypothetical protein
MKLRAGLMTREFAVCWWTVMNAVAEHGTPLVDDPDRLELTWRSVRDDQAVHG